MAQPQVSERAESIMLKAYVEAERERREAAIPRGMQATLLVVRGIRGAVLVCVLQAEVSVSQRAHLRNLHR